MFAFLAEHRKVLFPEAMFADLFPSGRGRPSVPPEVMASVILLQTLHGLSDSETTDAVTFDLRWKAAIGWPVTAAAFHDTTLTYWRRRLAASSDPNQTGALSRLQQRLAEAHATVTAAEPGTSPAQTWTAAHTPALGRAAAAGRELSWRSRAADLAAEALNPAPDALDVAPATIGQPTTQFPETAQPAPVRRLTRE